MLKSVLQRERIKQGLAPTPIETTVTCKDGSTRFVEGFGAVVANLRMAIYIDLTERKQMEEELRENEKQLHTLMDNQPVAVTWSDMDGNVQYINHTFQRLFGYTLEDIPTIIDFRRLAYPTETAVEKYAAQVITQRERIAQGLEPMPIETTIVCKDGSTRHVSTMGAVVSNRRMAIYTDITELKQMEEALRNSQKELQTIMDFAPVSFTWSDMDGNIQYINNAFRELFGYELEDIPTTVELRRLAYPTAETLDAYTAQVLKQRERLEQGKEATPIEVTLTCKDGSTRHVMALSAVTPNRRMVIYTDLTERIKMEEALRESQRQFQTIMDAAPVPVSWSDTETSEIQYVNKKFTELFGYTLEDIPTMTRLAPSGLSGRAEMKSCFLMPTCYRCTTNKGSPFQSWKGRLPARTGLSASFRFRGVYAANKLVVIFTDLTEQKHAEDALRESENKFRDLAEKSFVGVYLIQDNVFKYVNSRFAEIHGYTIEELVDKKSILDMVFAGRCADSA